MGHYLIPKKKKKTLPKLPLILYLLFEEHKIFYFLFFIFLF